MSIINFGSLNIDNVYQMKHFVMPGETASSDYLDINAGGKGLNQSIALANAGADVYHAGCIGKDGKFLVELLKSKGVSSEYIETVEEKTGHAIIQVDSTGQNCIILYGGANKKLSDMHIDRVLSKFGKGDYVLLQNEINNNEYIMRKAKEKGLKIIINPSPFNDEILALPLDMVDCFLINEVEGKQLTGKDDPRDIIEVLRCKYKSADIVLTLGKNGVIALKNGKLYEQNIFETKVVDTTAAGDTFTGFYLTSILNGETAARALKVASMASAIAVSIKGAAKSIPTMKDVLKFEEGKL